MDNKIETTRLTLRPPTDTDAAKIYQLSQSSSGERYMVFETEADTLEWIRGALKHADTDNAKSRAVFIIERKEDAEIIGAAGIEPGKELNGETELVFFIAQNRRNKGYATEACKAVIWWVFEKAGHDFLSAIINPENGASRRVLEKLGFVNGGARVLTRKDHARSYEYYRFYHTDFLPNPEWDIYSLYKPEPMDAFFDVRANTYNDKMLLSGGGGGEGDYIKLGACFPETDMALEILDIGCGTGLELDYIWARAKNARITCVDISRGMLDLLLRDHPADHDNITIVEASYIDMAYPESAYDIVVSNMTMHHLWPDEKVKVYREIFGALKSGGCYIEGDFMVDDLAVKQYKQRFEIITANLPDKAKPGEYHIDIPCSIETQINLLSEAGFGSIEVLAEINNINGAILKAVKS